MLTEITKKIKDGISEKHSIRKICKGFTLHTKIVIWMVIILISVGTLGFYTIEYNNPDTIGMLPDSEKLLVSSFQSVSSRTTGMSTINIANMKNTSKLLLSTLMMIGGAPGGTAGGIKTVTFAVIILLVINTIMGRKRVIINKKEISSETIYKAITIVAISIVLIIISSTILVSLDENLDLADALFECISALGTVGLTVGVTANLSVVGKILLIILMYVGRVTTITMTYAIFVDAPKEDENIRYPEEKVMI